MLKYNDISSAYVALLYKTLHEGTRTSPRGLSTVELEDVHFRVRRPRSLPVSTFDPERNVTLANYLERERYWYDAGSRRTADAPSKFWAGIENPDGTVNSNYGFLCEAARDAPGVWQRAETGYPFEDGITQWEWAYTCLRTDPDTRQAVMHFNRPIHQWTGNRDFPCTLSGTFLIRGGALHYKTVMRSQDLVKGFPYDLPYFALQLERMASQLSVPVGELTHTVHSLHYYERDLDLIKRMLG